MAINFLICGSIPLTRQESYGLTSINFTYGEDNRTPESIATNKSSYILVDETKFYILADSTPFLLQKMRQAWEKIQPTIAWTRNISFILGIGSLGAIYWKHTPGRSLLTPFNLIMGAAFTYLTLIVAFAYRKQLDLSSKIDNKKLLPTAKEDAENICLFRNRILTTDFSDDTTYPLFTLDLIVKKTPEDRRIAYLRGIGENIFTENETMHIFTDVFFGEYAPQRSKTLFNLFFYPRDLPPTSPKANFVNAYGNLITKLREIWSDLRWIKPENRASKNQKDYFEWEKSMNEWFDPSRFSNEEDKEMVQLFQKCKETDQKNYEVLSNDAISEDAHHSSFLGVYNKIKSKLKTNPDEATSYVKEEAFEEFRNSLYASYFKAHFKAVVISMHSTVTDNSVQEWLQRLSSKLEAPDVIQQLARELQ